jgi:hypothetical protein
MLRLSLSGDLHHYARYQGLDAAGQQKITAGGGGAYLYPTHHLPETLRLPPAESQDPNKRPPVPYRLEQCYPSRETSRGLRGGIVRQIFANPGFPLVPALLYLVIGTSVSEAFPLLGSDRWWLPQAPALLLALVLVGLLWLGLGLFSGEATRRNPARRRLVSGAHTLAHLVLVTGTAVGVRLAVVAAGLAAISAEREPWVQVVAAVARPLSVPVVEAVVGGLLGTLVVAGYLLLADRIRPGVNTDELFSAQAIADHKCFLRMRIDPDGTLTVFPVKIERSVTWGFAPHGAAEGDRRWFRPAGGVEPVAELIEEPIVVTKRPSPAGPGLSDRPSTD